MNQRGQEEAPFELLIAVILMTFVLFIGLQAMGVLSAQQCISEGDMKLEEFKRKLEEVIISHGSSSVDLRFRDCAQEEKIYMKKWNDILFCRQVCQLDKESCNVITWASYEKKVSGQELQEFLKSVSYKCLKGIPSYVSYPQEALKCGVDQSEINSGRVQLVDLSNDAKGIPKGSYILKYAFESSGTPNVCAIHRK